MTPNIILSIILTFSAQRAGLALDQENNITLPIILAIAGSIALLIGLFGGGVKAKEIEVPTLARGPRILSSLLGMGLIGIAIWLSPNPAQQVGSPTSTPVVATEPASAQPQITPSSPRPTDVPADTPTNTPPDTPTYTPSPTTEPVPEIIPFGSPSNPGVFNSAFGWQAGNSPVNTYQLASSQNALTLIANGHTDQWAELDSQPMILYPIEGNFETQVKVLFNPMWGHELAAIGVRSTQDHHTWLRLGSVYAVFTQGSSPQQHLVLDIDDQGKGGKIRTSPYPANTMYLKIERKGSVFDFYYSSNGMDWMALQTSYIAEMPVDVEIFLTVGSWGDGGISAKFYDFQVLSK
jgi:regulation of enolase protein 1 (concanavalin A-like superfamily)